MKSILESLKINEQLDQEKYPTMDPRDRRRVQSAGSMRRDTDDEDVGRLVRALSLQDSSYGGGGGGNDLLLEDFSNKLLVEGKDG